MGAGLRPKAAQLPGRGRIPETDGPVDALGGHELSPRLHMHRVNRFQLAHGTVPLLARVEITQVQRRAVVPVPQRGDRAVWGDASEGRVPGHALEGATADTLVRMP